MRLGPHANHWTMPPAWVCPQGVPVGQALVDRAPEEPNAHCWPRGAWQRGRLLAWSLAAPKQMGPVKETAQLCLRCPEAAGMCWALGWQ